MSADALVAAAKALRNERLHPSALKELVEKKIAAIVDFGYTNVPYYHDLFKTHDLHPSDIKSVGDLHKIPITDREDLSEEAPRMLARGSEDRDIVWRRTSGTTGEPLAIAKDRENELARTGIHVRYNLAIHSMPWHRTMHLVHSQSDPARREGSPADLLNRIRSRFKRLVFLDRVEDIDLALQEIEAFRPHLLVSHTYNLRLLALNLRDESQINLGAIRTGAGEVADVETLDLLEETFDCPAYRLYGAREVGSLGFECSHQNGYHINADHVYCEYLRNGEPVSLGELGETVWTTLDNRAMPMIRLRLGDLAIPSEEQCSCGRSLPLTKSIEGRTRDLIVLPDSTLVTPSQVQSHVHPIKGVARFRLIQKNQTDFELSYLPSHYHNEKTEERISSELIALLGPDTNLAIHQGDLGSFPVKWKSIQVRRDVDSFHL